MSAHVAGASTHLEEYYLASSWQLMRRRFFRHRLAAASGVVIAVLYLLAAFAGFFSPYDKLERHSDYTLAPPMRIRIFDQGRLRAPFVYGLQRERHPETLRWINTVDTSQVFSVRLFAPGSEYRVLGLIRARVHLFGAGDGFVFLLGTDVLGRDVFSRVIHGAQVSLSIGLLGVCLSFIVGCLLGGLSGFIGGPVDTAIQRLIEFLRALPTIPLWMALAAAVPVEWPALRTYFLITVILSILGWTGLARVVRGKILQLRVEDYVTAASIAGATDTSIVRRHMLPNFLSYLIVHLTVAVPEMILGETALSFIGVGLRAPVVSWGVALRQAQDVRVVAQNPWLLTPALFVVVAVLAFNFLGDGLRDAADPYA